MRQMRFQVWAPDAATADLVLGDQRIAMSRDGDWFVTDTQAEAGDRYWFSIDGGDPRPDPRSPSQPDGVHAASEVVDHDAFYWTDDAWQPPTIGNWIIYELHVGTFTSEGTFDAAIEKLPYLVDLGIDAVEILPVNEFSGDHGWGYDGVDLYAPHHAYGGPAGLKRFVDACHAHGLCAILDVVYNHLGPSGNYLSHFGPYFTNAYFTPWGDALNFDDVDSTEVRNFFIDNALMWLRDYHFDGLRLDAIHAILDTSAIHFLEEMAARVDELEIQLGRQLNLIAESDLNDPRIVRAPAVGGYGIDAQWSDDLHHALHSVLTGETNGYYEDFGLIEHLAKALQQSFVYDWRYSAHRRRFHGRSPNGLSAHRFLAYMQNHDQIGNRAAGDRISHITGTELAKVGAALVLTSPFIPMLFQGEEWAASSPFQYFTHHEDPDLGRAVSEGRRSEFASFGWEPKDVPDPQDEQTFLRSKLVWDELEEQPHADMLDWYRRLIRLRKETPELTDGHMETTDTRFDEEARWLIVERGPVTIACNFSETEATIRVVADRSADLVLASAKPPETDGDAVRLAPTSVAIFRSH